ncbi:unnamed protein product [Schistosoma curassoni]|uniref:NET domain-containing protein n=1 Tax=Schistosoma curassoni TaxID=6186 RepID=A0A183JY10_9TREM|nr:unnamed protein product [Schistosoma curassoni]
MSYSILSTPDHTNGNILPERQHLPSTGNTQRIVIHRDDVQELNSESDPTFFNDSDDDFFNDGIFSEFTSKHITKSSGFHKSSSEELCFHKSPLKGTQSTKKIIRNSSKGTSRHRKLPGPAGLLPKLHEHGNRQRPMIGSKSPKKKKDDTVSSLTESCLSPSLSQHQSSSSQSEEAALLNRLRSECGSTIWSVVEKYSVREILKMITSNQLPKGKIPIMCGFLDEVELMPTDAKALLKDNSASGHHTTAPLSSPLSLREVEALEEDCLRALSPPSTPMPQTISISPILKPISYRIQPQTNQSSSGLKSELSTTKSYTLQLRPNGLGTLLKSNSISLNNKVKSSICDNNNNNNLQKKDYQQNINSTTNVTATTMTTTTTLPDSLTVKDDLLEDDMDDLLSSIADEIP